MALDLKLMRKLDFVRVATVGESEVNVKLHTPFCSRPLPQFTQEDGLTKLVPLIPEPHADRKQAVSEGFKVP